VGPSAERVEQPALDACLGDLESRGPDANGIYRSAEATLAHTRLSIIDLSADGSQPMVSEDGSVAVVFNGEIYRFTELRRELEKRGHRFRSQCDTEVVLRGYQQWGSELLERIDGMFALGVWDARSRTLLLARDRLGKKPLFWAEAGASLAFSSLMRPLVRLGMVRPVVDPDALREYLFFDYLIGPRTIFADARLLPAGTALQWRAGTIRTWAYWDLAAATDTRADGDARPAAQRDADFELQRRLTDAVRARLVSDAPLGLFLSSGLDSLTVAALAVQESGRGQRTFTVGFEQTSYDERPAAARAAVRLGCEHSEVVCRAPDVPDLLPALARSADHLLADQSMIPIAKLAREARRTVKVVLTGDGGDELMAGYPTYRALMVARYYVMLPRSLRRAAASLAARLPAGDGRMSAIEIASRFFAATTGELGQAHASWRSIWSHRDIERLLVAPLSPSPEWRRYAERVEERPDWPLVKSAIYTDVRTWLVDSILAKVDRATMAVGLEARCPLLDHRVVEHAFAHLDDTSIRRKKEPLRRIVRDVVGTDLAGARKGPFQTPLSEWFAGPLRPWVRDRIASLHESLPETFAREHIDRVEREHAERSADHGLKLWSLAALAEWCNLYPGLTIAAQPTAPPIERWMDALAADR